MQITDFLNGLLAPFYALFGDGFHPATNFGQLVFMVIVVLAMIALIIKFFK